MLAWLQDDNDGCGVEGSAGSKMVLFDYQDGRSEAHACRKFIEAQQAQDKGTAGKADWAINHFQKLYASENKLKTQSAQIKQQQRQQLAVPLLKQLWDWLEKSKDTMPQESLVSKAIIYTQKQWPNLISYLDDGQLNIDNNRS